MPPPAANAAAAPAAAQAAPPDAASPNKVPGRKKKLVLIAAALAALLAAGGAATVVVVKKRAAAAAEEAEGEGATADAARHERVDPKVVPTFVALETFTVNLADREAERYAQIGVTLELVDAKAADQIKNYMPAIRNNILMVLAHKTSQELLEREGKHKLAAEILREAVRPLGYEVKPAQAAASAVAKKDDEDAPPVRRVHFSNFIIQ